MKKNRTGDEATAPLTARTGRETSRHWQGTWIPREVWLHPGLSWMERCLWAEIQNLHDPKRGGCYARNEFFATRFRSSPGSISHRIAKLRKLGLVEDVSFDGRTRIIRAVPDATRESNQRRSGDTGSVDLQVDADVYRENKISKKAKSPVSPSKQGRGAQAFSNGEFAAAERIYACYP